MSTEFKSTLPPRKRAKTKEEKEQRRVERILRNRRAAHASREKKRKHVEYLESYVLKLEANLEKSQGNFLRLKELVETDVVEKAQVTDLDDLVQLKEQIHMNLNNSASSNMQDDDVEGDDDEDSEARSDSSFTPTKKRKLSEPSIKTEEVEVAVAAPVTEVTVAPAMSSLPVVKSTEKDDLLSISPDNNSYYNYLSPISMTSPVSSPIDLKLETEAGEQRPQLYIDNGSLSPESDITRGFNSMGQNSEVILLPKSYDNMMMTIPC